LGPTQQRRSLVGVGCTRDTLLVVSLIAAVAPDAKLNTPAIGLATVPTTPLPKPAINPYDIDILSNNKVT